MAITPGYTFSNPSVLTAKKLNKLIEDSSVPDDEITSDMIAASSVTAVKFGSSAITEAKLSSASVLSEKIYPVGSVYINVAVSTNPATLLGFGTWTQLGGGYILIDSTTGYTTGSTYGGSHTHAITGSLASTTLTGAQTGLPSHSHYITNYGVYASSSQTQISSATGAESVGLLESSEAASTSASSGHSHSVSINSLANTVMPKSVYIYIFYRTA